MPREEHTTPAMRSGTDTHTYFELPLCHSHTHVHTHTHTFKVKLMMSLAPQGPLHFEVRWLQESHRKLCLTENKLSQLEDLSLFLSRSLSLSTPPSPLSFSLSVRIWFHSFRWTTLRPVSVVEHKWGCTFAITNTKCRFHSPLSSFLSNIFPFLLPWPCPYLASLAPLFASILSFLPIF